MTFVIKPMCKTQMMITAMRRAIAHGDKRTRKQWSRDFNLQYMATCTAIRAHGLKAAIAPVRAESACGVIQCRRRLRKENGRIVEFIYVPSPAIAAAGFDHLTEVAYRAEKGRIIIEPVAKGVAC